MDSIAATNRANCFKLFAACFCEPDRNLMIDENLCQSLQTLLKPIAPQAALVATDMGFHLQNLEQAQLEVDYAALFVGPFELIAAPYGSVYQETNRRVMGDSTLGVLRYYQDAGLSVEIDEPPDHIAIMLEFMYFLCIKEAQANSSGAQDEVGRYRDLQYEFYVEAIDPWVEEFCSSIRAGTKNDFYKSLADCLEMFLKTTCPRKTTAE